MIEHETQKLTNRNDAQHKTTQPCHMKSQNILMVLIESFLTKSVIEHQTPK
jgi:hypothetical protein